MERLALEFVFRSTLMILAAAIVLRVLRIRAAAAQHAVWTGVLLAMLALPLWISWGPKAALPVLPSRVEPISSKAAAPANPPTSAPVELDFSASAPAPPAWNWRSTWIAVYLLGAAVLLLRLAIGTARASRLTRADCVAPVTVGLFRPRIILPESSKKWPPAQLDAVLIHEQAHADRRDPLVLWLALFNRALFWFHPLAWWLERKLAALAEEACDAAVLERGHDARDYSAYLLDLARAVERAGMRVNLTGVAMPGSHLPQRIRKIVAGVCPSRVSRVRMGCAAIALGICSAAFAAATIEHVAPIHFPPIASPLIHAPIPALTQPVRQAAPMLMAQAPAPAPVQSAAPKFNTASVKPCRQGDGAGRSGRGGAGGRGLSRSPGELYVNCLSVFEMLNATMDFGSDAPLLNDSFGPFSPQRIRGGPAWFYSDFYTVDAQTDDPVANGPTEGRTPASQMLMGSMLRALLEDRFQMKIHREVEQVPMYALTVAESGYKLQPMEAGGCTPRDPTKGVLVSEMFPPGQKPMCITHLSWDGPNWIIDAAGQSLARLAGALSGTTDRHVLDKTGVAGEFTFRLIYAHDQDTPGNFPPDIHPRPASNAAPAASIFAVLEQQLGLKLVPDQGPREFLVVDHVERPSEN